MYSFRNKNIILELSGARATNVLSSNNFCLRGHMYSQTERVSCSIIYSLKKI